MKLYIDLETMSWVRGVGDRSQPDPLIIKRGDTVPLEITFLTSNAAVATTLDDHADLSFRFGVKLVGQFDTGFLAYTDTFAVPTGEDVVYTASLNLNTVELDVVFGRNATPVDDVASVDTRAELSWFDPPDGGHTSTASLPVTITNDIVRGDETEPTPAQASQYALLDPGGQYRITAEGDLQLWDTGTSAFRTVTLNNGVLTVV